MQVEECASECFADAECNFFVYGNPMSMTNQMRCDTADVWLRRALA